MSFDIKEFISAFIVIFAMIDVTGLTPVVIDLQQKSGPVNAAKAAIYSLAILVLFLFAGNLILELFSVDIHSFAVAGGFIIFLLGIEMTLGIEIFRYSDGPKGSTTLVPVVFPLIAGAGTFTALLSLRAEYHVTNILLGLIANIIIVYLVLKNVHFLERVLGQGGIYVLRKFFGIILLAIAVKLFVGNIALLIN
ncbi:MAG: MarC family protein [Bacteroidales bacterium]|nr:MarC family protein [Candidatus Liminaster caballi]